MADIFISMGKEKRDVIVAAFACGGKMNCKKEADAFAEPPLVINVPGGSSSGFTQTAQSYRRKSSILENFLLAKMPAKYEPRRICMITFSAGWAWSTQVLRTNKDPDRIDTVIVMDGIHTRSLKAWENFAIMAGRGGDDAPKLWMAHTQIKPPFVSAKKTNTNIIDTARAAVGDDTPELAIPNYIWDAELKNAPISVYSKIERPTTKLYHKDPLDTFEHVGNVARFEYEGGRAQDHIYNAQYTQPRFWQWLRELWSDSTRGVFWDLS